MDSLRSLLPSLRGKGIVLVGLLFLSPFLGLAQSEADQGVIRGIVVSSRGQPLSQTVVTLLEGPGKVRRETDTDAQGAYQFSQLPDGNYRIEAAAEGHITEVEEQIQLSGTTVEINFSLEIEITTLREVEERGVQERNPNIFVRKIDLNALRDPVWRRGIEPVFLQMVAVENKYGSDMGAPVRQMLFARPQDPLSRFNTSVYWVHENGSLNARPFFNVGPLRPSKRNQFGASTGGPLSGERLFFTTSLDFVHESGFVNGNIRVPLSSERTPTADDPETAAIVAALLEAYPLEDPNLPSVAPRQLNTNAVRRIDSVDWNLRTDYQIRSQDRLAFQYTFFDYSEEPFELVAGQNPETELRSQTFSLTHIYSGSPGTLVESSFQYDRLAAVLRPTERFQSLVEPLGLEEAPDISFGGRFGDLSSIGPGGQFSRERFQNRFSGHIQMTRQSGSHQLRFGGGTTRIQLNDLQSNDTRGTFNFTDNFGRTPVENFLEGTPTTFTVTEGELFRGFRNWEHAMFLQDTYQVRPGFTLNLGLRYEIVTVPSVVNDLTDMFYDTDANNFAPHLALAWAPGGGSTVVRAGYGISFGHVFPATYQRARFNPPAVNVLTVQNPSLKNPLEGLDPDPGETKRSDLNLLDSNLVSSYTHQYNLFIQRRLPGNLSFQVGYVGHGNLKPIFAFISNRAEPVPGIPPTTATIDERRPDPRFLRILNLMNSGTFYYHGLKTGLSRSLAQGLTFGVDYIFSKALSTTSSDFLATFNLEPGPSNHQNLDDFVPDLKSNAIFDHRHVLVLRYSYGLPFQFSSGLSAALFEGWEISGVTEFRTGRWFGIASSSDAPGFGNVDGEGGDRVNILNPDILGKSTDNPDTSTTIFNPEFFDTNIVPGGRGDIGLRVFRADSINNTSLTLTKSFRISERENLLQFRAEFLNLFNHPLFARAGDVFPADIFGRIVDTQNKGRVIRLTLRMNF